MKNLLPIPVFFFLTLLPVPALAQEDVNLFDYWEFYSDVENSMYKTSCNLAFIQLNKREAAIAELKSKQDYLARQDIVNEKLERLIGPIPDKTPLNAKVTGVIKKEDYKVEKLIYESMPNYFVTAALFLPNKRKGKLPAIIYASGHTVEGFRSPTYQHIIINLVKKGFAVFAFDPIGQGERWQYYNKDGDRRFNTPTIEHSYPGAQCYISGYSPTNYFVWDGVRGVDYLLSRKEIDPNRIGMTGRSGGGTQTAFTAAVDDRILAAAPECFITNMEYVLKSIGPQDAEQNIYHMISEGLDHADLLEVRAPKPGLMITTTRDFFSIQGARETFKEVKQFYAGLGSEEQISMVEDDDIHTSTKSNRQAMYAFFQKHLTNPGDPEDLEVEVLTEEELWVTKTGKVDTALEGETLFSLNKKIVEMQEISLAASREVADNYSQQAITKAQEISGFQYPLDFEPGIFSGRYHHQSYVNEKFLVPGGGSYPLPVAYFKPIENPKNKVVLILDELGMDHAVNGSGISQFLLQQGYSVLALDVPGIGSLGPGYLKGDAYVDNTSFNQWFAGILTGKSIVAMRVEDMLRVINFIKTELTEIESIYAISIGAPGSELLHLSAFDPSIEKICLLNPFLSYSEIALAPEYKPNFIPSIVSGAISEYDLPDLIAALSPKKVLILNPVTPTGENTSDLNLLKKTLQYPLEIYKKGTAPTNLKLVTDSDDQEILEQLRRWIE